jgi:hypothetical protein
MQVTGHIQAPVTLISWKDSTLPVESYKTGCDPHPVPRRKWGGFVKMSVKGIVREGVTFVKFALI